MCSVLYIGLRSHTSLGQIIISQKGNLLELSVSTRCSREIVNYIVVPQLGRYAITLSTIQRRKLVHVTWLVLG